MQLKLFSKNAVIYAIGNIVLRSAAFLLIPIYTHYLSVKEYGLLASLFITTEFLLILMGFGMRTTLVRFCKEFESKNLIGRLLGTTILINVIGGLIVTTICVEFLLPFFSKVLHVQDIQLFVVLVCISSLVQSLFLHITSYYRAKNEATKFMLASILAAGLLIVANIFLLVKLDYGIKGALMAQILSYGSILILILIHVLSQTGIEVSIKLMKEFFQFGFPLIFSKAGEKIIGAGSIYILSFFAGLEVVAIYALGNKLARLLAIVFMLPFQMAFEPYIFANLDKPGIKRTITKLLTYFLYSIALVAFTMLIGTKFILPLIAPPEYASAYLVMMLLLPALAIKGLSIFGEALLNIVRKTYINGAVFGICGLLSILLNYLFIPYLSWYGVVLTLHITFTALSSTILIWGIKEYPIEIEWRRIVIAITLFLIYLFLIFILQSASNFIFYSSTILTFVATVALIYFSNILDNRERRFIKKMFSEIQLRFTR